jgi:hypothetical protein
MENKPLSGKDFANSPIGKFFLGGLPILGGILTILVSLNILPYVDLHPNRIAIFNDPHTWEAFVVGMTMLCFGIANILPPHIKWLGKFNNFVLLISFLAVVIGVILSEIN